MERLKSQPFLIYENESALVCHFDFMTMSLKVHLHFLNLTPGDVETLLYLVASSQLVQMIKDLDWSQSRMVCAYESACTYTILNL